MCATFSVNSALPSPINDSNKQPHQHQIPGEATEDDMAETSRQKATVFVGGLDPAVSKETLFHAFLPFGEIVDVTLPKPELPSNKDPHRGYGYVEFEHAEDAKEAIDNMDRSEMYGHVIKVAVAKPQKDHTEGLGSKTAVWEQVSLLGVFY
jgi:RNA recognition motif-containing protein